MKPDIVVDIGNTRVKWGRCAPDGIAAWASLPPDAPSIWQDQLGSWGLTRRLRWVVSGVNPNREGSLIGWLRDRGDEVLHLERATQLPLRVALEAPDCVGIDRLLDAVAANARRRAGQPAVIVDAGTAVTVDWLDETGAFRGGAIFPGLRLMATSLHQLTAYLPLIEVHKPSPPVLGTATRGAMESGIYYGTAGAINTLITLLSARTPAPPAVFLTGGDAAVLVEAVDRRAVHWPEMTLEGVRLAAEALP